MMKTTSQARLRLLKSENFDRCSSYSFTADMPLGSSVRPCSMSLTADGDKSVSSPMAASVMPMPRRSDTRDDQVVTMIPSLRQAVDYSQRLPVTGFRNNPDMPRPPDLPRDLHSIGQRIRWWREHRDMSRKDLAKRAKYSYSGLADLENGESQASEKLHLIAAALQLNAHYLETGEGEPETGYAQDPPPPPNEWPFPAVPLSKLKKLNKIERGYLETELLKALADIEAERRNKTA